MRPYLLAALLTLTFPDFDDSGEVDFADFLLFVAHFGTSESRYDLDGDGRVGFSDFLLFVKYYGKPDPSQAYNIDVAFKYPFTPAQRETIMRAVRRWESVITGDLPDVRSEYLKEHYDIGPIDDLLITFYAKEIPGDVSGYGGPLSYYTPINHRPIHDLPFAGSVTLDTGILNRDADLYSVTLHEIGHVLGIGAYWWWWHDHIHDKETDPHFTGVRCVAAFNALGGHGKVPLEDDLSHWREDVFGNEIMTPVYSRDNEPLSRITLQALADIGYQVDVTQADLYTLP